MHGLRWSQSFETASMFHDGRISVGVMTLRTEDFGATEDDVDDLGSMIAASKGSSGTFVKGRAGRYI
jgi:hypothetical protein